jgi:hypothetical protein
MHRISKKLKLFFTINLLLSVFLISPTTVAAEPVVNLPAGGGSNAANSLANDQCSWSKSGGKYCLLAPLGNYIGKDGVLDIAGGGLSAYLKALFNMGIVLATGLAVIMITMGGLKYVSTDAINGKSEGKGWLRFRFLGRGREPSASKISTPLLYPLEPEDHLPEQFSSGVTARGS